MNLHMLGDFSARNAGLPMSDFVYLQRRPLGRYLRRLSR